MQGVAHEKCFISSLDDGLTFFYRFFSEHLAIIFSRLVIGTWRDPISLVQDSCQIIQKLCHFAASIIISFYN